jgi:hypothetical protein
MAILAESGGSGTGVNATKTAAQIAAEARLTSLNNSIAQINQTNAAANKLAAEPVTPTATKPASAATSATFNATLNQFGSTSAKLDTALAAANAANAPATISDAEKAQLAADKLAADKAAAVSAALGTPVGGTGENNKPTVTDLNTGPTKTQVDSIAAVTALLSSYGLGDLGPAITSAVMKGYSTDTINLIMQDPNSNDPLAVAFQQRFPANKARLAAGKSVLSPAEYLAAERTYTQVLQSYGVANLATHDKLNQFITNDISATEVADRVSLAINRVQNADASTKVALAQYYPMLNQADIVSAVLNPAEALPALQRKITIGEIGGAALGQGLTDANGNINVAMGAGALADLGVTQAKAREGFQQVADLTPKGNMLSDISTTGQRYGQLQAEQEAFQGLASAKRARLALTAEEQARFQALSGNIKGAPPHTFSDSGAY